MSDNETEHNAEMLGWKKFLYTRVPLLRANRCPNTGRKYSMEFPAPPKCSECGEELIDGENLGGFTYEHDR